MKILFTKEILQWLKQQGYTHILQRGIENKPYKEIKLHGEPAEDYVLVPLKETDFSLEDAWRVLPIDSTDVSDMLDVEFGIDFYVALPGNGSEQ